MRGVIEAGEVRPLREAFEEVFRPPRLQEFGSVGLRYLGVSDGNPGVQWSTWLDRTPETDTCYAAVNLEGMKYDGWPIARLIERELEVPRLPEAAINVRRRDQVEVCWWRDAWQGAGRLPRFAEHTIGTVPLDRLSTAWWRTMLRDARACFATRADGSLTRARRTITLLGERPVEREVTPHLQFRLALGSSETSDLIRGLGEAREQLAPLHAFVAAQSA